MLSWIFSFLQYAVYVAIWWAAVDFTDLFLGCWCSCSWIPIMLHLVWLGQPQATPIGKSQYTGPGLPNIIGRLTSDKV